MSRTVIGDEKEFELLMKTVDSKLQLAGVPVQAREFLAVGEIAKVVGSDLRIAPLNTRPIADTYTADSLSAHIARWYTRRYGDRLKIDFCLGYSVILLRDDPWLLRFPLVFGRVSAVCDRSLSRPYPDFSARSAAATSKATFNLLRCIKDLPQGLASALSDDELRSILDFYLFGHEFLNKLNSYCRNHDLAMLALSDLEASANHCIAGHDQLGLSRWASLQAAEKLLKHYLEEKHVPFKKTHNLEALAQQAEVAGLPQVNNAVIASVQCTADVRYQRVAHNVNDVVRANHSAMEIGRAVVKTLYP